MKWNDFWEEYIKKYKKYQNEKEALKEPDKKVNFLIQEKNSKIDQLTQQRQKYVDEYNKLKQNNPPDLSAGIYDEVKTRRQLKAEGEQLEKNMAAKYDERLSTLNSKMKELTDTKNERFCCELSVIEGNPEFHKNYSSISSKEEKMSFHHQSQTL